MRKSANSQSRNRTQSTDSNNSLIISSILKKPNKSKLKHQRSVRFEDPDDSPIIEYNPEHNTLSVQQYHMSPNTSFSLSQSPSRTRCSGNSPVSSSKPTRTKNSSKSCIENSIDLMKELAESQLIKDSETYQSKSLQETKGKVVINVKYSRETAKPATKDLVILKPAADNKAYRSSRSVSEVEDRKNNRESGKREGSVVRENRDDKMLPEKEKKETGLGNDLHEKYSEAPIKIITAAKLSKGHEPKNSPKSNPKTIKLGCRDETFYNKLNYYLNAKTSLSPSRVPSTESQVPTKKPINLPVPCPIDSPSTQSPGKTFKSQNPVVKKTQNIGKSFGMNVLN